MVTKQPKVNFYSHGTKQTSPSINFNLKANNGGPSNHRSTSVPTFNNNDQLKSNDYHNNDKRKNNGIGSFKSTPPAIDLSLLLLNQKKKSPERRRRRYSNASDTSLGTLIERQRQAEEFDKSLPRNSSNLSRGLKETEAAIVLTNNVEKNVKKAKKKKKKKKKRKSCRTLVEIEADEAVRHPIYETLEEALCTNPLPQTKQTAKIDNDSEGHTKFRNPLPYFTSHCPKSVRLQNTVHTKNKNKNIEKGKEEYDLLNTSDATETSFVSRKKNSNDSPDSDACSSKPSTSFLKKIFTLPRKLKSKYIMNMINDKLRRKKCKLLLNICAMSSFVATLLPFLEIYDGPGFEEYRVLKDKLSPKIVSYINNTQNIRRQLAKNEETFKEEALKRVQFGLKESATIKEFAKECKNSKVSKASKELLKFLFHASLYYCLTFNDIISIFNFENPNVRNSVFDKIFSMPFLGGGYSSSLDSSSERDITATTADESRTANDIEKEEDAFDTDKCLPTRSSSEFYTCSANFKLNRDQYKKILAYSNEHQRYIRDGNKNYEAYPNAGSVFVVNIAAVRHKVSPSLTVTQAESESRTDAYRWGKNQGSNKTPTSTMPFWFARDPLLPYDQMKHVDFKKTFFKHIDYPDLALVHYVGDESLALKEAPHGNAKHHQKPFKTALKSVLAQQQAASSAMGPKNNYHQVMQNELQKDGSKQLSLPRNIMQTYNAAKVQRMKERASSNTLYNCYSLSRNLKFEKDQWKFHSNFISEIHLADPYLSVHLMNTPICHELLKVQKTYDGVMMLYYDTTFFIGDFYVSTLSWFHPFFGCYLPLATLVHTTRHSDLHRSFLIHVGKTYGFTDLKCTFCLVTDAEFKFKGIWSNIRHLFCSLHIHRNMEESLVKLLKPEEFRSLEKIFISLKTIPSFKEFDEGFKNSLKQHQTIWKTDSKSTTLFEKYVKKLRNKASIPALLQVIGEDDHDFNLFLSLTSNPSETMHNQLKHFLPLNRELMMDEFICASYNFCALQYNECYRGYFGEGSFIIRTKFDSQKLQLSEIDYDQMMIVPNMVDIINNMAAREGPVPVTSNWPRVFCVEAIEDHVKISTNELNQHTVNIRGQDPALVFKKTTRSGESWTCSCRSTSKCAHILIVMKHLEDDSLFIDDGTCGDALIDDKNAKGVSRSGRKRPRAIDIEKSENVFAKQVRTDKISLHQPVISGEREGEKLLIAERNELYKRSQKEWSPTALPKNHYEVPKSESWINTLILPSVIGNSIFYHNFTDPLPLLKQNEILLGVTIRGIYHVVIRVADEIHAVIMENQLSMDEEIAANATTEDKRLQRLGGLFAACGRDVSNKKVKVRIHLHDNSKKLNRHGKLLLLATFVELIKQGKSILNRRITVDFDSDQPKAAIDKMLENSQTKNFKVFSKFFKLYCCCSRAYVEGDTQSEMVGCSSCKKWFFMSCFTTSSSPRFSSKWLCPDCYTVPLEVEWGKSPYTNTCTIDNFLMTMMLHNENDIIIETILTKACPTRFETNLITFLNAAKDSLTNDDVLQAKYKFIDAIYDTQNLFACEDLVWNESLVCSQYGVRCSYNCNCGFQFSHLNPADHLTVESLQDISTVVEIGHSFTVRRTCGDCGGFITPSDVKFVAETPFLFAIRLGGPICNANINFSDFEKIPFELTVNSKKYKLASLSFHEVGHYVSIIFHNQYNVIFYDGISSTSKALPTTLKKALKLVAERRCLLSFITYVICETMNDE